jgi:hypothetical protein
MVRKEDDVKHEWTLLAIATFCILALAAVRLGAQSVQPTSPTYSWSGELVAFDPATRTMTVKSRVVADQARGEMPTFKAGDRIVITWSGFDMYSDGIARAVKYDASKKWSEPFTFPVEFVAYETPREYVTFKLVIPAESVDKIKPLKAGEWVTGIAKHRPASEAEAITTVHAYSSSASQSSRASTN